MATDARRRPDVTCVRGDRSGGVDSETACKAIAIPLVIAWTLWLSLRLLAMIGVDVGYFLDFH